jgi:hypothetical protein
MIKWKIIPDQKKISLDIVDKFIEKEWTAYNEYQEYASEIEFSSIFQNLAENALKQYDSLIILKFDELKIRPLEFEAINGLNQQYLAVRPRKNYEEMDKLLKQVEYAIHTKVQYTHFKHKEISSQLEQWLHIIQINRNALNNEFTKL